MSIHPLLPGQVGAGVRGRISGLWEFTQRPKHPEVEMQRRIFTPGKERCQRQWAQQSSWASFYTCSGGGTEPKMAAVSVVSGNRAQCGDLFSPL